ncbi:hypothetical protein ACFCZ2_09390 [Streptomyces sp. NPDC056202]|uniref:hypothetical protein n=1 Tax=Streptomyces sp. NPDC056202 TaxID=3345745 RepID=UPI0035DEF557
MSPETAMLFAMDNEKRMTTWCRMWNEDPSLAHGLMSDDCVQWSDRVADLDSVVGPDDQERFVTAYRARHVNIFSPRVLVDAGNRFAYLWDVEKADGRTLTGIDVNIVKDDRIQENWTFVAQRRYEQEDPEPHTTDRTDLATLQNLCRDWVQLRNGRAELAAGLATDDFRLFSGTTPADDAHGPTELAALIERQAATNDPPAVALHRQPVIDTIRGHLALLWTARTRTHGSSVGGVDLLTTRSGRITHAWSLTGTRPFRY